MEASGKEDGHFTEKMTVMDKVTALVLRDKNTRTMFAHICTQKGAADTWVVKKVLEDLDYLGHVDVILKCDGEPALVQLVREVKRLRKQPTFIQHSPAYDPQSNGVAEHAVQEYMGQFRRLKIALERRIGGKVESDWPVMEYISEHSTTLLTRYQVGTDGKTPYKRLMGKQCKVPVIEFGEQVLAKPMSQKQTQRKVSLKSRWIEATSVGITRNSNGHVVVLPAGGPAISVRTVKRRLVDNRWSFDAIKDVKSTVRHPNPKNQDQSEPKPERLTQGIDLGESEGQNLKETKSEEKAPQVREFRIT